MCLQSTSYQVTFKEPGKSLRRKRISFMIKQLNSIELLKAHKHDPFGIRHIYRI
jgi:hypothetical protein